MKLDKSFLEKTRETINFKDDDSLKDIHKFDWNKAKTITLNKQEIVITLYAIAIAKDKYEYLIEECTKPTRRKAIQKQYEETLELREKLRK